MKRKPSARPHCRNTFGNKIWRIKKWLITPCFIDNQSKKIGPGYFSFKKQQGFHIHVPFKLIVCDGCQFSLFMQLALDFICLSSLSSQLPKVFKFRVRRHKLLLNDKSPKNSEKFCVPQNPKKSSPQDFNFCW